MSKKQSKKTQGADAKAEAKCIAICLGLVALVGFSIYQVGNDSSTYNIMSKHQTKLDDAAFKERVNKALGFSDYWGSASMTIKENKHKVKKLELKVIKLEHYRELYHPTKEECKEECRKEKQ